MKAIISTALGQITASLVAQMVKHLPAVWETWVRSLGWKDLLEKEMATHSSTLAWKIPRMEEPRRLQSMGSQRVGHNWETSHHFISRQITLSFIIIPLNLLFTVWEVKPTHQKISKDKDSGKSFLYIGYCTILYIG